MAKSTKSVTKKVQQSVKVVLAPPFAVEWPIIPQDYITEVKNELLKSTSAMALNDAKIKWCEISKVQKNDRPGKRKEFLDAHLKSMTSEEKEAEAVKKSKWSFLIQGYNSVMRNLEKNNLSGVLIKRNVVPDILGLAFVPVCFAKNIPLIPIDDLDSLLKNDQNLRLSHSIVVVGLKKSQDTPFVELTHKMTKAWSSKIPNENTILVEERETCVTKVQSEGSTVIPKLDASKYLLKRNDTHQRAFMIGKKENADFLSFSKSLDCNTLSSATKEDVKDDLPLETNPVDKDDIELDLNPDFFFIDTVEESTKKKKKSKKGGDVKQAIKRKLKSDYIPAAVMKMKPNPNRKKQKKT